MSSFEQRGTPGAIRRGAALKGSLAERRVAVAVRGCRLGEAVGRLFVCEEACPFWETGGAVAPCGCLLERLPLDLARQPEAAQLLAALKERLERSGSARDRREANTRLSALVDHVLHDEV